MSALVRIGESVKSLALQKTFIRNDIIFLENLCDNYDGLAYCNFLKTTRTSFAVENNLSREVVNGFRTGTYQEALEHEAKLAEMKTEKESFFPGIPSHVFQLNNLLAKNQQNPTDADMRKMKDILVTLCGLINKKTGLYKSELDNALVHAVVHKLIFMGEISDDLLCGVTELIQYRTDYEEWVREFDDKIPQIVLEAANENDN